MQITGCCYDREVADVVNGRKYTANTRQKRTKNFGKVSTSRKQDLAVYYYGGSLANVLCEWAVNCMSHVHWIASGFTARIAHSTGKPKMQIM